MGKPVRGLLVVNHFDIVIRCRWVAMAMGYKRHKNATIVSILVLKIKQPTKVSSAQTTKTTKPRDHMVRIIQPGGHEYHRASTRRSRRCGSDSKTAVSW